jgi:hypothetical protein
MESVKIITATKSANVPRVQAWRRSSRGKFVARGARLTG